MVKCSVQYSRITKPQPLDGITPACVKLVLLYWTQSERLTKWQTRHSTHLSSDGLRPCTPAPSADSRGFRSTGKPDTTDRSCTVTRAAPTPSSGSIGPAADRVKGNTWNAPFVGPKKLEGTGKCTALGWSNKDTNVTTVRGRGRSLYRTELQLVFAAQRGVFLLENTPLCFMYGRVVLRSPNQWQAKPGAQ